MKQKFLNGLISLNQKKTRVMNYFFTILYIKTNRLSEEKIAIGLLANFDGIPYFGFSSGKLNFALKSVNPDLSRSIKRSLQILQNDVNKIIKGEEVLSLFDQPYAKKILEKLTLKKRGLLIYSDLMFLESGIDFAKLYKRYVGDEWEIIEKTTVKKTSFKTSFHQYTSGKKFESFTRRKTLHPNQFPFIYNPVKVDLWRKTSYYTVFQCIDFNASSGSVQNSLTRFRSVIQSLTEDARRNGYGKGRYYLVYNTPKNPEKVALISKIKAESVSFELITMTEMMDKV